MTTESHCITLTEDAFFDEFKPIHNHLAESAPWEGAMFETYGAELDFVRAQDPLKIWTIIDCDEQLYIDPGVHFVNRLGYLIASKPRLPDTEYVIEIEQDELDPPWTWEEAFDKFGFGDGDHVVHTGEVTDLLTTKLRYEVTETSWSLHNVVITSIKTSKGRELIPPSANVGYDDPRTYLPKRIVALLDRALPCRKGGAA